METAHEPAPAPSPPPLGDLGGWPGVLARLMAGEHLSGSEAAAALGEILGGRATPSQVGAFMVALRMKGETVDEMTGLVRALLAHAEPVPLDGDVIDTCGTGGDRSGSINVSTLASLVVAGAGGRVCKHGNRAASSATGSADVLEALGVRIDLGPAGVVRCVEEAGMGFCFAMRFHPAMRHAGPVRRELGVPTVFNFLGPLANPARPRRQVIGVSDPRMAERVLGVLAAQGAVRAMVVYGHDGLDEITTTTTSTVLELDGDERRTTVVDPAALGLAAAVPEQLRGGDAATNAELARRVLEGERGARRDVVVLNAAAGLVVAGLAADLAEGLSMAQGAIDNGRAAAVLERLVAVSQAEPGE